MKNQLTLLDLAAWSAFIVFSTSSVILPICLPEIIKTIPFNFSESGSLETFRNSVVLIILVLSILIVRLFNKKQFIAQGQFLISLGLFIASYADSYIMFIISIAFMGIGGGLSEAYINPFIVDIHPRNAGRYLNLANAFYPIGIVISTIIFGELLTWSISWQSIFRMAAIFCFCASIFITLLKYEPVFENKRLSFSNYFEIVLSAKFWLFAFIIFLGGCIESALTFWSRSFVSIYLNDTPRYGTMAVTIFALSMFAGRLFTSYFAIKFTLNNIMLVSAILGILIGIILPWASSLLEFYILISFAGLATACLWPTILAVASNSLPFDKTTLLILLACMGVLGFGITPLLMGIMGDYFDLKLSFLLVPIFFMLLALLLIFENKKQLQNDHHN